MIGMYILLGCTFLFAVAFLTGVNTSMGGTRSDYNDGSGALLVVAGIVTCIVEVI